MPIECSQYFIILFRVNQVFTFYHFIDMNSVRLFNPYTWIYRGVSPPDASSNPPEKVPTPLEKNLTPLPPPRFQWHFYEIKVLRVSQSIKTADFLQFFGDLPQTNDQVST